MWRFISKAAIIVPIAMSQPICASSIENLLGLHSSKQQGSIVITVITNGCTKKEDFETEYEKGKLTFYRNEPDKCKKKAEAINISFSLKEIGIKPIDAFVVTNNFIVNVFRSK